jgi:hypothetical protein
MASTMIPMKTALISFFAATLLGAAFLAGGRLIDAANLIALLFSAGLVAWTVAQYSRVTRPLSVNRPVRLPVPMRRRALAPAVRLAA